MNHPDLPEEERLRRILDQTVADVEPHDRLDAIRDRTKVTAMTSQTSSHRPWLWGALGAAVATAAVIGGIAVVGNPGRDDAGPAGNASSSPVVTPSETSTGAADPSPSPADSSSPSTSAPAGGAYAVYYVGDTPYGPRLFREFHSGDGADPLMRALGDATSVSPQDPDYRTDWPADSVASVSFDGVGNDGLIQVVLADGSTHDRPAGMSKAEAGMAVEQLIYTAQAATQTRAPVQFLVGSNPTDQVFGVPTSEPLAQGKALDVLSLMSITSPAEGATVSGTFDAVGVNNSFEATVIWQVKDGNRVVKEGYGIAGGWMAEKLFPWTVSVDVSDVPPGTYTFVALNDDPSGGTEAHGPYTDTRTITVE